MRTYMGIAPTVDSSPYVDMRNEFQPSRVWNETEYDSLQQGLSDLYADGQLSSAARARLADLIAQGLITPSGQASLLGVLLNPAARDVLVDVLADASLSSLPLEVKGQLQAIAVEPEASVRQALLSQLVLARYGLADAPVAALPPAPRLPQMGSMDTSAVVGQLSQYLREGDTAAFADLLASTPNVSALLQSAADAGVSINTVLIELLAYPDYTEMAMELLFEQGDDALPALQAMQGDPLRAPAAQLVVDAIYQGVPPSAEAAIGAQLDHLMASGDSETLATYLGWAGSSQTLLKAMPNVSGPIDGLLIDLLADDRLASVAMDSLYHRGLEARQALMTATGSSNPDVVRRANAVIDAYYSGVPPTAELALDAGGELSFAAVDTRLSVGYQPLATLGLVCEFGERATSALLELILRR